MCVSPRLPYNLLQCYKYLFEKISFFVNPTVIDVEYTLNLRYENLDKLLLSGRKNCPAKFIKEYTK